MNYIITRMLQDELKHYGILGQKWGVRRYQNINGTLTEAGIRRYRSSQQRKHEKYQAKADAYAKIANSNSKLRKQVENFVSDYGTGKGQAWRNYAVDETKYAQKAIKVQDKANRYMTDGEKKNVRDFLRVNGVEIDRFSAKNLKKADKDVLKAIIRKNGHFTRKDELNTFNSSIEKSLGVKDAIEKRHPDINFQDHNDPGVKRAVSDSQKPFKDSVRKDDSLYRKYGLDQSSSYDIAQKRFKSMLDHIDRSVSKAKDDLTAAGHASKKWFNNGKVRTNKPKAEITEYRKKLVNYWDTLNDAAMKYIEKNVPKEEQELAKGIVYYSYIDW